MAAAPASSRGSSTVERIPGSTSKRGLVVLGAIGMVLVLLFAWLVVRAQDDPVRQTARVVGDLPVSAAGWRGEQLENAAIVMQAARDLGLSERDVRLGVMTAMGESSLRVLDRGDRAGPDSRGLFQQRDPWGPYEVRMDAYGSAVLFFRALAEVEARDGMRPTRVAPAVQINRDPEHYERWWDDAGEVVAAVDGADAVVVVEPVG
ncbi:peptidase M23 [Agrococcus beijingensis]|uniref:peptidase M23 n=1 Tax=Agrococcus beijingensis TaxID=3068634 RepID=UPI002740CE70|nr:peptidase M23 [Agrococcus sp. REN33]